MKITDVEAVLLSHVYPEDERLEWSAGTIESWDASLVRVETDNGLVGWGEAGHTLTGNESVPGIVDALRPQVLGRDPNNVKGIRKDLYDRNVFWARGGVATGVVGAVEIAVYDILAQDAGVPVYKLLGGRRGETVPVYGSGGIAATPADRIEQARTFADRGFDVVKVRTLGDPMENVAYVEKVLEAVGPDVRIAIDAVQGSASDPWPVKDAIRLGRALEEHAHRIYWYEEPCRAENIDGYRRVRDALDLRISGIESRTGRYEYREVIEAGAVDVLNPDVTITGGFEETSRISGHAASYDIPLGMHVWGTGISLLANLHYALADTNCAIVEYCQLDNPLREEMLPDSLERDGGEVKVPDEPGLGLDIPDGFLKEHAYVPRKGHVFD